MVFTNCKNTEDSLLKEQYIYILKYFKQTVNTKNRCRYKDENKHDNRCIKQESKYERYEKNPLNITHNILNNKQVS